MSAIFEGDDGKKRCTWCAATSEYIHYHDNEWGYPVDDDIRLFEKICLEGFQSGLSWLTILNKRDNFRDAFENFDFNKVALFSDKDIQRLLKNEGIIRHRGKIEATINNAKCAQALIKECGSLAAYFWSFESKEIHPPQLVSFTETSKVIAKDLKKRGWKFVGPTTVYAFMQAMGLVNDHDVSCDFYAKVNQAKEIFVRPKIKYRNSDLI